MIPKVTCCLSAIKDGRILRGELDDATMWHALSLHNAVSNKHSIAGISSYSVLSLKPMVTYIQDLLHGAASVDRAICRVLLII